MKTCRTCKEALQLDSFSKDKQASDGLKGECRTCSMERNRVRRINQYGITVEQYNHLYEQQGGCCAICERHQAEFTRRFDIDHNHDTGEVRGLLCHDCNRALGFLQDSPAVVVKAADYLLKRGNYAKNI